MKNHIFPAFLLLAAVMTAAIGCGDSDTGPVDGTAVMTGTTDTTAVTETENIYANDLGDYDFGGDVFTMYTRDVLTIHDNMDTEATDGSTINHGVALKENHLYMMTDQRGVLAAVETVVLVRGEYMIV